MRYQRQVNTKTGKSSYWLLLWTIPFILLSTVIQTGIISLLDIDSWMSPLIEHLPKYDLSSLAAFEYKGAWWILGLFIITSVLSCVFCFLLFYYKLFKIIDLII
jgi:hypothetical protein